jgi:hypothetical protein
MVLVSGLLLTPVLVAAQVEIGLDAGVNVRVFDDVSGVSTDSQMEFDVPSDWARVAFAAGDNLLVETLVSFERTSQGDESTGRIVIIPGVVFLLGEQLYVRGEAGLARTSFDPGTASASATQYLFGGAAGLRMPLGDNALFRIEGGLNRAMEADDDFFIPAGWNIRGGVGISAVIN